MAIEISIRGVVESMSFLHTADTTNVYNEQIFPMEGEFKNLYDTTRASRIDDDCMIEFNYLMLQITIEVIYCATESYRKHSTLDLQTFTTNIFISWRARAPNTSNLRHLDLTYGFSEIVQLTNFAKSEWEPLKSFTELCLDYLW